MNRILFLLIVGGLGCAVLVGLGVWQLQRLSWKEGILAQIDTRMAQSPAPLPTTPTEDDHEYLPVVVDGTFSGKSVHVLTSSKSDGPGFRVVEGFTTATGRPILVDRGFLPADNKADPVSTPTQTLTGHLLWPNETDLFTPDADLVANTWFARDVSAMSLALGTEQVLIVAAERTDPLIEPLPIDTSTIPNDHLNYAITWFGMAAVWLVMSVIWFARSGREPAP